MQRTDKAHTPVRELLDLIVNWENLKKVHIPLGYATRKAFVELGAMLLTFLLAVLPILIVLSLTFRDFMHVIKPVTADTALRSMMYIAMIVVGPWLLSRAFLPAPLGRLRFLLRSILPLTYGLTFTLAGG